MWSSWARPVLPRASLASPARWHIVHSIHVSRHTVYWVQAQVGFGRVYFPGPNRVGARAHFMRWAQPILRLSRRACARANDGLACVNAGQPLMKNLSHFVKSVLYVCLAPDGWPILLQPAHRVNLEQEGSPSSEAMKTVLAPWLASVKQWKPSWRHIWPQGSHEDSPGAVAGCFQWSH